MAAPSQRQAAGRADHLHRLDRRSRNAQLRETLQALGALQPVGRAEDHSGGGHYFAQHQPRALARIIEGVLEPQDADEPSLAR